MNEPIFRNLALVCVAGFLLTGCSGPQGFVPPAPWVLPNGIHLVVVPIPKSDHVSIFTFVPMGLASDPAGKTQWSHLVEHLVIRSTHPASMVEVNGEALPDCMHLDFYGTVNNWRKGLTHHAAWLSGCEFNEEILQREASAILAECDSTAGNLATHKFAMAAWAQASRHGSAHAAVRGDLAQANLDAVRQYHDKHFAVLAQAVVCIVGGVTPEEARAAVAEALGGLESDATSPESGATALGDRAITWDLPTRHLILSWLLPKSIDKDYAALYAAATQLQMRLFQDQELKKLAGVVLVGADLGLPEGHYFYVNAVLQPGAEFEGIRAAIDNHVNALQNETTVGLVAMTGKQLAYQLTQVMDPAFVMQQAPPEVSTAMIEGNLGLQWGMRVFQFGADREALARYLSGLTGEDVQAALKRYLTNERRLALAVRPV